MDLEHVGVKSELVDADELLQIDIHREVEAAFVDCTLFQAAGGITKRLADVSGRELHAVLLQRIGKKAERLFLHGALTRVRIGRLVVVGLLILLGRGAGCQEHDYRHRKNDLPIGSVGSRHATS